MRRPLDAGGRPGHASPSPTPAAVPLQFAPPDPSSPAGPFAALSLIVAPAILTNAASLLTMSTSNRLARAVDLARELARELEGTTAGAPDADTDRRLREMAIADRRGLLILRALRAVYAALAGFATATLVSLLGAVFAAELPAGARLALAGVAAVAGVVAVGSIVWAAVLLVRETRLAVATLRERVAVQQARFAPFGNSRTG